MPIKYHVKNVARKKRKKHFADIGDLLSFVPNSGKVVILHHTTSHGIGPIKNGQPKFLDFL